MDFFIQIFNDLIQAFPAAVSSQWLKESELIITPLGLLLETHGEIDPESHVGKVARLLMERMITPSSDAITNAIKFLFAAIVAGHVKTFLGDPLSELDLHGHTILSHLLRKRREN